ncbi:MAG: exonuclease SbcCD subunit D [Selenomonadaceae bacterium]|nr:exonuclease SbcCD subunit D [Selenomonadaceae bacterium]
MKFFHLSDLHLGLKLMQRDLREEQEYILGQVAAAVKAEKPDALIIAGDIYDKAIPSAEAVTLFDWFIGELMAAKADLCIMAISGNHDSAPRVNVFRHILARQHFHLVGLPPQSAAESIAQVTLEDDFGKVHFYLLPFVRPSMMRRVLEVPEGEDLSYDETVRRLLAREKILAKDRNVLVSHQFYLPLGAEAADIPREDSEIITVGNIDTVRADVLSPFDYAALGHIHRPMKVGAEKIRYSGTPLAYSVSEAGQAKGIVTVELKEKGKMNIDTIPLKPRRAVRTLRGTLEELLRAASEDYVTLVVTDPEDIDVIDMQDRLKKAFPFHLDIRRETARAVNYEAAAEGQSVKLSPMELMDAFLPDLTAEERQVLQDVVNAVQGGEEN